MRSHSPLVVWQIQKSLIVPSVGENIRRGPQSALLPGVNTEVGSIGDALAESVRALSVWTL